jgi:hypothetical protein
MSGKRTRATALAAVLLAAPSLAAAQAPQREVLTNDAVIEMVKAGLSPTIVASKVATSDPNFDLSSAELVRLKQNGVPDEVIEAMMRSVNPSPDPSSRSRTVLTRTAPPNPAASASAPGLPSSSGIFISKPEGLTQLDPTIYTQSKATGAWKTALTYGVAKTRTKSVLSGRHARLQVDDPRPVFYFDFEVSSAGLSYSSWYGPSTNPGEFVLVKLDEKKDARELETGSFNFAGSQSGAAAKQLRAFDFEKLRPGIYKVVPKQPLEEGEYCFVYAGAAAVSTSSSHVYDFGVKRK